MSQLMSIVGSQSAGTAEGSIGVELSGEGVLFVETVLKLLESVGLLVAVKSIIVGVRGADGSVVLVDGVDVLVEESVVLLDGVDVLVEESVVLLDGVDVLVEESVVLLGVVDGAVVLLGVVDGVDGVDGVDVLLVVDTL